MYKNIIQHLNLKAYNLEVHGFFLYTSFFPYLPINSAHLMHKVISKSNVYFIDNTFLDIKESDSNHCTNYQMKCDGYVLKGR